MFTAYHFFILDKVEVHNKYNLRGHKLRINSSNIGMESARTYTQTKMSAVRFSYGKISANGLGHSNFDQMLNTDVKDENDDAGTVDSGTNSHKTGLTANSLRERFESLSGVKKISQRELSSAIEDIRQQCLRYIYELLFGRQEKNKRNSLFDDEDSGQQSFEDWMQETTGASKTGTGEAVSTGLSVDVFSYEAEFIYTEQETTAFSTVGTVKTADGREINFNLDVEMSRSFSRYYKEQYQVQSVRVCDPLVINLDTNIAELEDQKFFFDLDADGEQDEISMLSGGSGYLALDKNQDGTINDGSELFGTGSGDGFADLEKYDQDGNGWIDEDDAIFDKLKIWCKDENGNDVLYSLADKGVGAICLKRVGTEFSLNSQETNDTNGYIRSTGVFLYENGMAGTVQHVDVAKSFAAKG